MKDMGGFRSDGEFGSLLREIFRPDAAARFAFERWANLRGRPVAVFSYRIDRANSKYTVAASTSIFRTHRILTGMMGHVYLDPETGQTLRFGDGDDGLPRPSHPEELLGPGLRLRRDRRTSGSCSPGASICGSTRGRCDCAT